MTMKSSVHTKSRTEHGAADAHRRSSACVCVGHCAHQCNAEDTLCAISVDTSRSGLDVPKLIDHATGLSEPKCICLYTEVSRDRVKEFLA